MPKVKCIFYYSAAFFFVPAISWAQDNDFQNSEFDQANNIDRVVTYGRAEQLIGTAESASDGVVGYDDFTTRPLLRVGELVEVIPGMVVTQHSGSGKANQYFLRGFNLDHGTDFLSTLEGMPINLPTHGHGQGYLDLNFIIPEIIETVEYRKGPYSSEVGDFSSAGSTTFNVYDSLDENFTEINIGQYGYYRIVSAGSAEISDGNLLFAAEGQLNDGPWVLDDDLKKYNAMLKYSRDHGFMKSELLATAYHSTWNATDQIASRAVTSGLIDERGNLDDDLGGETTRMTLSAKVETENLKTQIYGQYYDFNLFSNFTYFLENPIRGDEFEQVDNRSVWGGNISYSDELTLDDIDVVWTLGGSLRCIISEVGLHKTESRIRFQTIRDDEVDELALGTYADLKFYLSENLRITTGLRADRYSYSVDAIRAANSGTGNDIVLSPKFAAAYRLSEQAEVYANYGHGFHSNDVRGAAITVDPVSGDPVPNVPIIAKSRGGELGIRFEPTVDINFTVSGFWLAFDVTAATTDAKFNLDNDNYIPGSVGAVLGAGTTLTLDNGLTASLRLRHFGSAPLIEDNSVRSELTTLVNFGATYDISNYTIEFNIFNLLGTNDRDITYFYESQLQGEANAVSDIHYHPVEPFTVRLGFKIKY